MVGGRKPFALLWIVWCLQMTREMTAAISSPQWKSDPNTQKHRQKWNQMNCWNLILVPVQTITEASQCSSTNSYVSRDMFVSPGPSGTCM